MAKTTFEMDGLFTQEDIDNRFYVMRVCLDCGEWSRYDTRSNTHWICQCGSIKYDRTGPRNSISIRTWLVTKDMKVPKTRRKS